MLSDVRLQTPFQQLPTVSQGYLSATLRREQPLCGNSEGWGPLSPIRYDFTPCFLDVWIAVVAAGGVVGGAIAIWYLMRQCSPSSVKKDWHFYAKLVCSLLFAQFLPLL